MATVIFYKNDKYVADISDEDLCLLENGDVPAEVILDEYLENGKAFWKNGNFDYEIRK